MSDSAALFEKAKTMIPGGVNSPVRAFNGVGGHPIFFEEGKGAYLQDIDGNQYIDYVGSWGPLILGHCHPKVVAAVQETAQKSSSFGAPHALEIKMAEKVCSLVPSMEMVRMVNSGTEATMSAIRVARGFTSRNKILKFEGCYHGHADHLLVKAGSGALTLGIPNSAGVPEDFAQHTLTAAYNNLNEVESIFNKFGHEIAAIILEPIACNMNCILPLPGFLKGLREMCDQYQSLLIFDEIITGFRLGTSGAQGYYNIKPDLTTLGKIIGGGLPVGAYGGSREIMQYVAPLGPVYQAGTLSGNPLALSAGLATLEEITKPHFYENLAQLTQQLVEGIQERAMAAKIPLRINHIGSILGVFFTEKPEINRFSEVMTCDIERFKKFFHAMLNEGIYLAPSAFEAWFISAAHTPREIALTLNAIEKVFAEMHEVC